MARTKQNNGITMEQLEDFLDSRQEAYQRKRKAKLSKVGDLFFYIGLTLIGGLIAIIGAKQIILIFNLSQTFLSTESYHLFLILTMTGLSILLILIGIPMLVRNFFYTMRVADEIDKSEWK